jgi:hypothetical protein
MQEHLHIGRPRWSRLGRFFLILFLAGAFPFVVGLHMRFDTTSSPNFRHGDTVVYYAGCGPQSWYEITTLQTNLITPLFVCIPPWEANSNFRGMRLLGHDPSVVTAP